jgi:uncharacterized cupin superfamily protein
MENRRTNVVNDAELTWDSMGHGVGFHCRRKQLGRAAGGRKLGCSLYELRPGKSAWPAHYHTANEEAIYILEGRGTLRLGAHSFPVARGDYIAVLAEPAGTHRLTNTSDGVLRYLCMSTMIEPEITVYPDSNKIGIFAGAAPGGPKEERTLAKSLRADAEVDYWENEE